MSRTWFSPHGSKKNAMSLTRLRATKREEFRVTIFGSARILPTNGSTAPCAVYLPFEQDINPFVGQVFEHG